VCGGWIIVETWRRGGPFVVAMMMSGVLGSFDDGS
jgi:hypothetical protein